MFQRTSPLPRNQVSPKIDAFVDRHGWQIIVFVVSAVIAWTTLKAQVQNKAEKVDVDKLRAEVQQESAVIQRQQRSMLRMLCRDPRNRLDSECP